MEAAIAQFPIGAPMTEAEYKRERAVLQATYGNNRKEAGARFEQELAKFFTRSGWTQEQLAKEEKALIGRGSQSYVSEMLTFGRFLQFIGSADKTEDSLFQRLTQRSFRDYWCRTEGNNDRVRFQAVMQLMEEKPPAPRKPLKFYLDQVAEHGHADGMPHRLETILSKFDEADHSQVTHALDDQCRKRKWERSSTKQGKPVYRSAQLDQPISSLIVANALGPIIEELKEQGKRNTATVAISAVALAAHQLQVLVDEWTK